MSDAGQRPGLFWKIQGMLRRKEAESIRDQVEELIERQEGPTETSKGDGPMVASLDAEERALLGNVLRLRGITAYDVMVPRADIMAIPESHSLTETIGLIQTEGHSRYPIYRHRQGRGIFVDCHSASATFRGAVHPRA
jgi:magnesium and cobalt transporter